MTIGICPNFNGQKKYTDRIKKGRNVLCSLQQRMGWITDYEACFNQTKETLSIDCMEQVELLCLSLQNRDKICADMRLHSKDFVA